MRLAFFRRLAFMIAWTLTPDRAAIALSVSFRRTT
jgi:hypothetical protein